MLETLTNLKSLQKSTIVILYDFVMTVVAFYLSFVLRYGTFDFMENLTFPFAQVLITVSLIQSVIFYFLGLYRGIWRFSSTPDLVRILKAVSLSCVIVSFVLFIVIRLEGVPRSIFFIDWTLLIIALGGGRFAYRLIADNANYKIAKDGQPVLIVGAGQSGNQLFNDIRKNKRLKYKIVGFIDDNPNLRGKSLQNIPVLGATENLVDIIKRTGVKKIFIAIPSASSKQVKEIVEKAQGREVSFKILPKLSDIIEGKNQLSQLRNIKIEDLLGRDSVSLDTKKIHAMITNNVVMVTGAGGTIGSEICHQVSKFSPSRIICFEQSEFNLYALEKNLSEKFPEVETISIIGDVRNSSRVEEIIKEFCPDVIVHAAAYKHVPIMENNPFEAVQTNVLGTRTVAKLAGKYKIKKFVLISTDKAVNPTNVMGASKRIAEISCELIGKEFTETEYIIVRFGNVLGSSGSVIPLFRQQIEKGGPVTVTHKDVKRYFMSIPEASQLVLEAAALGSGGEIFILDMGSPVKIIDLAKQMITLSGYRPNIDMDIIFTGLRPGEKLFEELLADEESTIKTTHPKVQIAKSRIGNEPLAKQIDSLLGYSSNTKADEFKALIRVIVPEYVSAEEHYQNCLLN